MKFKEILQVLEEGGTLFVFDNPLSYGLDDHEGNTLVIHNYQAEKLINNFHVSEHSRPSVGCTQYKAAPKEEAYVTKHLKNGGQASFIGEPSVEMLEAVETLADLVGAKLSENGEPFKILSYCEESDPGLDNIMGPPLINCPGCSIEVYQAELDQYGGTCGLCQESPEVEYKRIYGIWARRDSVIGFQDSKGWECYGVAELKHGEAMFYLRRPWPYK